MNSFFLYLKEYRSLMRESDNSSTLEAQLCLAYLNLMGSTTSISDEKIQFTLKILREPTYNQNELLHKTWLWNALARHYCINEKIFDLSLNYLKMGFIESINLLDFEFSKFNQKIKCQPLIFLLNFVRLSRYAKETSLKNDRIQQMLVLIQNQKISLCSFPDIVQIHKDILHTKVAKSLLREDVLFFEEKLKNEKHKN